MLVRVQGQDIPLDCLSRPSIGTIVVTEKSEKRAIRNDDISYNAYLDQI